MNYKILIIATLLCSLSGVANSKNHEKEALVIIKNFYAWAIKNKDELSKLEPTITEIQGSTRFFLDTSNLPKYSSAFLESGFFSKNIQSSVSAAPTTPLTLSA